MAFAKKSLRLTRFICLLGIPVVWLIAVGNIAFQYANLKRIADPADNLKLAELLELGNLLGDLMPDTSILYQNLAVTAGHVLGLALLSTAVLAIAISVIDMRNIEAMKRRNRRE